jgi:hypothetical protein
MSKNPIAPAVKFVKRNERRILISTAVVTTTAAVLMRGGLKQHDDFLKLHGLYDAFYTLTD